MLYKYLQATYAPLNTSVLDINKIEVHTINLANSSNLIITDHVGVYTGKDVHHRITGANITGTGNLTLQSSFNDIDWFDTEDSNSNNIVINLNDSFGGTNYKDVGTFANYQRWVISGTNTTGNLKIITTVK